MDSDNILEIGALINLGELLPGMDKMASSTLVATKAMGEGFKALATTTASSTAQMSTIFLSIPPAAQKIPPAVENVRVHTVNSTNEMGFSWKRLATSVGESAVAISEHLTEVGAKISETAERSRLGIGTMEAGFTGLSKLLGAGIAVSFAAHFMDEAARVVIELKHLQVETGISIETLSGLRAIAQQTAVPFESLQMAIVRMQRAQVQAVEGSTMYVRAFRDLGLSVEQLRNLTPEQLFFRLATAIATAHNPQVAMSSAIGVFGRGVYTLLPLLREYGSNLQQLSTEAGKNSGITDKAAESALEWHKMTAELAQSFQALLIPALKVIIPLVHGVQTAFHVGFLEIKENIQVVHHAIIGFVEGMKGVGKIIYDAVTGNFKAIPGDAANAVGQAQLAFNRAGLEIKDDWKNLHDELTATWAKPIDVPAPKMGDLEDLPGGKVHDTRLTAWREELDKMRDAQTGFHELSKAEEAAFWKTKLEIAKGNAKLYAQVFHEYVTAERAARKESLTEELAGVQQRLNATKAGSAERVAILQEELSHLKVEGAEETSDYRRVQEELVTAKREQVAEDARLTKQRMDVNRSAAALDIDAEAEHQKALLEVQKIGIDAEAAVRQLSGVQRLALDRQIVRQEFAIEYAAQNAKLALYEDEPKEFNRIKKQLTTLNDNYNKQLAQNDAQQLKERSAQWQKFSTGIANDMARAVGQMMEGQRRFGQVVAQLWNQLLVQFAQMITKQVVLHLAGEFQKVVATTAGQAAQTGAVAAGTAARNGISIAADLKEIYHAAAVAAAKAYAAIVGIPYVGPILAPIAAGVAFAGVMAYGALATAEKGGLLDKDTLVAAHANEMILPPKLSSGLQNLINVGGFGAPSSLSRGLPNSGGAAGGGSVVHHHAVSVGGPRINVTVAGNQSGMKDMHNQIVKTVQTAVRRGALSFEF